MGPPESANLFDDISEDIRRVPYLGRVILLNSLLVYYDHGLQVAGQVFDLGP